MKLCKCCNIEFVPIRKNQEYAPGHRDKARQAHRNATRSQRANPGKHAARARTRQQPPVFIGIDTEGRPTPEGYHVGILLGCGQRRLVKDAGLEWWEVLGWLYQCNLEERKTQPNRKLVFCGFSLGYDFTVWLRSITDDTKAWLLLTDAGMARRRPRPGSKRTKSFPVDFTAPDGVVWEVDWLPYRRLDFRPKACAHPGYCACPRPSPWMYVCDVFSLFQSAFIKVVDPAGWPAGQGPCTPEEFERIVHGKATRGNNTISTVVDDEMIAYQQAEIAALQKTMELYERPMSELQIAPSKADLWYGPGSVAGQLMRNAGVPKLPDYTDPDRQLRIASESLTLPDYPALTWRDVSELAKFSYFGGWAEITVHGHIPGTCWRYDINSAYPHILAQLPCLLHGRWSRRLYDKPLQLTELPPLQPGQLRLIRSAPKGVRGSNPYLGAMLHRRENGGIYRPRVTGGVYWQHELEAAVRAGLVDSVLVVESWTYTPCDCPPPLRVLAELYAQRQKVIREVGSNAIKAKVLKLAINSVYGKCAQKKGAAPYRNWLYASLTTAGTRAMICDAIAAHPEGSRAVTAIATDSVTFLSPNTGLMNAYHDDDRNPKRLGEWTFELVENLTQVKPGMYWDDSARKALAEGKTPKLKARGADAKAIAKNLFAVDKAFDKMMGQGPITGWPEFSYVPEFGIRPARAAAAGKWEHAGLVVTTPETHRADPLFTTTSGEPTKRTAPYRDGDLIRTRPPEEPVEDYSYGYEREEAPADDAAVTPDGWEHGLLIDLLDLD